MEWQGTGGTMSKTNNCTYSNIKAPELADAGERNLHFAIENMPVLTILLGMFGIGRPFEGKKIAICCHITKETAVAALVLRNGGGEVLMIASTPDSTQDDIAACLVKYHEISVCGSSEQTEEDVKANYEELIRFAPDIILDEGGAALSRIYEFYPEYAGHLEGVIIQTASGVIKSYNLEKEGLLKHPVIDVDPSRIKHVFDNYFGVGQTGINSIARISNILIGGETVAVIGYGNVGKSLALRAKGMGAHVIVCEIDPIKALNAYLEGYQVMSIQEAAEFGNIYITATGSVDVIPYEVITKMKHGAILANCGSGRHEIATDELKENAISCEEVRPVMMRYDLDNGKCVHLLADGGVVNLCGSEGNPPVVMDLTFTAMVLSVEYLVKNKLKPRVYTLPEEIDEKIALLKLNEFEISLSEPTETQIKYDKDWHK